MRVISGKAKGTKLNSIENMNTRPTLDRVKESLFNIMQNKIEDMIVLDLFAGSGAIGIEFLSRGSKKVYFCDKSQEATKMIKQNLERTRFLEQSFIYAKDYQKCLETFSKEKQVFDIIFLDPPYEANIAVEAVKIIKENNLLKENGIIIIETDNKERELQSLEKLKIEVHDLRKYGRVYLLFLS